MDQAHFRPLRGHVPQVRETLVILREPLSSNSSLELYGVYTHTNRATHEIVNPFTSFPRCSLSIILDIKVSGRNWYEAYQE
eukprot:2591484-Amphidinium_carterae.1